MLARHKDRRLEDHVDLCCVLSVVALEEGICLDIFLLVEFFLCSNGDHQNVIWLMIQVPLFFPLSLYLESFTSFLCSPIAYKYS
jgi:hypothetical protein